MKQIAELIEGRPLFHIAMADKVRDAAQRMTEWNIGAVAVLDDERLAGVFSERDLMARVVAKGLDPDSTPVSTVMTRNLVVASPDDEFDDAIRKMHAIGSRHLPVVENGKLIGMISLRDLLEVDDAAQRQRATFLGELVTYSPDYET